MTRDYRLGLRTLREEVSTPLAVEGTLPDWLSGTFLRNGPGRFEVGGRRVDHWFDGLAMLRRFAVDGSDGAGAVAYANRFLRSEEFRSVSERDRLARAQFGTVPRSPLARLRGLFALTDNASIGVDWVGGRYVAVTETPRMVAFDPESLESGPTVRFDDGIEATGTLGHPHWDPRRDELVNLGVRYGPGTSEYLLLRRDRGAARRELVGAVPADRRSYVHSFALAADYAVLVESPLTVAPGALLTGGSFAEALTWRPDRGTRLTVLERRTGAVVDRPVVDPFFAFHHANAYQDDDALVVDLIAYDGDAVAPLSLANLRSDAPDLPTGELRRYRIDLAATGATVDREVLHPGPVEFPTIDYRGRNGRPHRYVYAAGNRERPPGGLPDRVCKVDTSAGAEVAAWCAADCYPGEAVFVPAPDQGAEDDGVLLSVVLDADAERSFLLVLDAADLTERARAPLPHALPFGFHGHFVRDLADPVRSMA
ncbi:beta-carotene 15,15'-monooxygenase [Halobacteriales archaeon QS_5_70_17]|nr:MAG: beta-carotene 15,15'-monooxygenase [Halobacteriales archaeon QS_5_70_17]